MVLDQFQTIYRKDYLWPYVRSYGIKYFLYFFRFNINIFDLFRSTPQIPIGGAGDNIACECRCPKIEQKKFGSDQPEAAWSRLGPMGPLLDPKVYPAKVGVSPESQISRFNQPNVYLEKVSFIDKRKKYKKIVLHIFS